MSDLEKQQTLKQFHNYLSSILKVYQDLIPVLKQELNAINSDDVDSLNECLKFQQALMLQTKNFEEKVAGFQNRLGIYTARNLSETIGMLPEASKLPFFEILGQFGQTGSEVKFYQEKCRSMLQSKLYLIDKALAKNNLHKNNITYTKEASEVQGTLLSKALEIKV